MASQAETLPIELLELILSLLDKPDLKSARLVRRLWGNIGAAILAPHRVYFAPYQYAMEGIASVAANSTLNKKISEVVYDGRLLLKYDPDVATDDFLAHMRYESRRHWLLEWRDFREADLEDARIHNEDDFNALSHKVDKEAEVHAKQHEAKDEKDHADELVHYLSHMRDRDDILNRSLDYEALCNIFKTLPNVSKISLEFEFESDWDDSPIPVSEEHHWYCERTTLRDVGILKPKVWENGKHRGIEWDFRGIRNFFKAASILGPNINNVRIGQYPSEARIEIFHPSYDVSSHLEALMERVKSVELDLLIVSGTDTEIKSPAIQCISKILKNSRQLECLSSLGDIDRFMGEAMFHDFTFPALKRLILGFTHLAQEHILLIMSKHRRTLREVKLWDLGILTRSYDDCLELANSLGEILDLDRVEIAFAKELDYFEVHSGFACRLMPSIPAENVQRFERGDWIVERVGDGWVS